MFLRRGRNSTSGRCAGWFGRLLLPPDRAWCEHLSPLERIVIVLQENEGFVDTMYIPIGALVCEKCGATLFCFSLGHVLRNLRYARAVAAVE
jgi:hypothetical protein